MDQSSPTPLLVTETPAEIQAELAQRGIGFEQWPALQELPLEPVSYTHLTLPTKA